MKGGSIKTVLKKSCCPIIKGGKFDEKRSIQKRYTEIQFND